MTEPVAAPHTFELRSFSPSEASPPPPTMKPTDPSDLQWTASIARLSGDLKQMINAGLAGYDRQTPFRLGASSGSGPGSGATEWASFLNAQRLHMKEILRFQLGMTTINSTSYIGVKVISSTQRAVKELLCQQGS